MDYTEWARDFFKDDRFATEVTGINIDEAREGYARCTLQVSERHFGALGIVMGGALFTLADFAFAVAANAGQQHTVSMNISINYLSPAHGPMLTAIATPVKSGRRTCTYIVDVFDGDEVSGTKCAFATAIGHRVD